MLLGARWLSPIALSKLSRDGYGMIWVSSWVLSTDTWHMLLQLFDLTKLSWRTTKTAGSSSRLFSIHFDNFDPGWVSHSRIWVVYNFVPEPTQLPNGTSVSKQSISCSICKLESCLPTVGSALPIFAILCLSVLFFLNIAPGKLAEGAHPAVVISSQMLTI